MTKEDIKAYESLTTGWICGGAFTSEKDKVKCHCHITGRYGNSAHSECNLTLIIEPGKTPIPVIFHNLKGYDSHLIMQRLFLSEGKVSGIASNTDRYVSFSLGQLRFIDSLQFMNASIEKLVEGLSECKLTIFYL